MLDKYKKTCTLCNSKHFFVYSQNNSYICTKCLNMCIKYNGSNLKQYSIDELKKSITQHQSIKEIRHKEKRLEFIHNSQIEFNNKLDNIENINFSISGQPIKKLLISDMPEYNFSNITKATKVENISNFIVLDVETTGLNCRSNSIIEVSAIKFLDSKPVECFSTLVNPNTHISDEITGLTGITEDMIKEAPYFYQILPDFNKFIANYNIVGHNLEFDLKFLYVNGVDLFSTKRRFYDTLDLAHKSIKKSDIYNYKLDTIADFFNIHRTNSHRSKSDAYTTGLIFKELIEYKRMCV